ncbi:hypothetical protein [Eisenbergiella porci]|uniref:hypothetical protein n=1 Tax=Eisenbergiella porci TaxID=2652274 RepID=UPI002A818C53|nr:hypothetical protein [Eisenbergiella porci]
MEWLTLHKDLILFFTSLFAFGYSIFDIFSKRTNVKLEIAEYYLYQGKDYDEYTFCINIDNNSSSPISITKLLIMEKNGLFTRCYLVPAYKGETYFPRYPETDLPLTNRILSASFPINLAASESTLQRIVFKLDKNADIYGPNNTVTFQVITNKRNKTFILHCPYEKAILSTF